MHSHSDEVLTQMGSIPRIKFRSAASRNSGKTGRFKGLGCSGMHRGHKTSTPRMPNLDYYQDASKIDLFVS